MKHQPLPPFASKRRKVSVEVYFVLYLSAIVLLLGTTTTRQSNREEELEEAIVQLLAPDFRVDAEKVALIYRFLPASLAADTTGVRLSRDSVNIIRARGSFSDVDFSIIGIEDTATGETLPIESATLVREGERNAAFTWRPKQMLENAVYRVTVAATATPLPPSNLVRPEVRERIAEILRRHRVSDSVTFTINVFAVTNLAMLAEAQFPPTNLLRDTGRGVAMQSETLRSVILPQTSVAGSVLFRPVNPIVRATPRSPWSNSLIATGVLSPRVTTDNARITSTTGGLVEVSGIAPATGEQEVVVEGVRSDGERVTARFTVNARPLDAPKIPQSFYPGTRYSLDFSSESVPDNQISVDVFLNDRKIISRENVTARFNVQPDAPGKLVFHRYVGDQQNGKFAVDVVPLPRPVVGKPEFKRNEGFALIRTTSWGYVNERDNLAELKIEEGNADDPELVSTQFDETNMRHTQLWRIRQRDEERPFWFQVHAIDQRGSRTGKSASARFNINE